MYKVLLCWRYLKTRYLAFACIISVMLGVATLIVVNSVMNGFSSKLRTLLHSVTSDVVVEAGQFDGFPNPLAKVDRIRKDPFLGAQVEAMAVTLETFAILQFVHPRGEVAMRPVRVVGIEPKSRISVGGFRENLELQRKASAPSFDIPNDMRDVIEQTEKRLIQQLNDQAKVQRPGELPPPLPPDREPRIPKGIIVGHLIANQNYRDPETGETKEYPLIKPGEIIKLTTVASGANMDGNSLKAEYDTFVVVDFFQSKMSDFDGNHVFVPLEQLQLLRAMDNRATNILIKLKDYSRAREVRAALAQLFAGEQLAINTWEEKQGPLLKAIEIEKGILDVLLFMIIAVAGFGILSIFSMIVREKTRDIGILKALGASNGGVMKIFLSYGLLLGVLGAGLGTILGLTITHYINEIETLISTVTGSKVFDGNVYYFDKIPTAVQPMAVTIVNLGSVAIAVLFSILPAMRAAMLHPVQALRYE